MNYRKKNIIVRFALPVRGAFERCQRLDVGLLKGSSGHKSQFSVRVTKGNIEQGLRRIRPRRVGQLVRVNAKTWMMGMLFFRTDSADLGVNMFYCSNGNLALWF